MIEEKNLERDAYEISHNWFFLNGSDFSVVDGLSLGKILQLQVFEKIFEGSQVNSDNKNIKSRIKALNLEWSIRAAFSLFDGISNKSQSDIVFLYDVNNNPMIEALNHIFGALVDQGRSASAIVIDKNIAKKSAIKDQVSWFSCFSIKNFLSAINSFTVFKKSSVGLEKKVFDCLSKRLGVVKTAAVTRYFKIQSFQLILEIKVIKSLLQRKNPKVVVLASDAHRVSRIVVFLCKQMNIKTVVYQHGATVWEYGYVPVFADHMLTWGKSSREWFELRGVNADRLKEIGNIRSDSLGYKEISPESFTNNRKIYFLPNPIDRKITEEALAILVDLCEKHDYQGIVKVHPSETNLEFFSSRIDKARSPIIISAKSIDKVGINPGDVAIVVNSTAGVDCCLEGAFILNIEVDTMPNPIDYEGFQVGIKTGMKDYLNNFERLIAMKNEEFLIYRKGFIDSYLGKLDGRVAQRASEFIMHLIETKNNG